MKNTSINKTNPGCELRDYTQAGINLSEVIDAFQTPPTPEQDETINAINDQVETIEQKTRLQHERALEGLRKLGEKGVIAAGTIALLGCEACVFQGNCDVNDKLEEHNRQGAEAIDIIQDKDAKIKSREAFGRWRNSNDKKGLSNIIQSHTAREKFITALPDVSAGASERDSYVADVAKRIPPNAYNDYITFMHGVHAETVSADQCQLLANKNGWTLRTATQDEDIKEGSDFIFDIPTSSGVLEVRIDAKSRNKHQEMVNKGQVTRLRGSYVGKKINQQGNPVLVVSPDGSYRKSGSITPETNSFKVGKREIAIPSFAIDNQNAKTFRTVLENEILALSGAQTTTASAPTSAPVPATRQRQSIARPNQGSTP